MVFEGHPSRTRNVKGGVNMTDRPKVAFIGSGNLGQCMAAHMALNGYDVSLGNRTAANLQPIIDKGNRIEMTGYQEGIAQLSIVSDDLEKVMDGRDVIVITVPANAHRSIAEKMVPFLKPTQHVVLHPGHTFGALEVRKVFEDHDPALAVVTVSEIQSSLFTTRALEQGKVMAAAIKQRMAFSTLPSDRTEEVLGLLSPLYKELWAANNVLETGLDNLNAVAHPVVTLMNTARIEHGTPFLYYQEGVSPAVGKIMEKMDGERQEIAKAIGVKPTVFKEWMKEVYELDYDTMHEIFNNNPAYAEITAPTRLDTRYIFEDVPTGLIPMTSLARKFDVKTPLMDVFLELCRQIFDTDFMENARSLEVLGLGDLTPEQLLAYVKTGHK